MEELGPTFGWKTQIVSATAIKQTDLTSDLNGGQNGELLGDIYLRGGGDPDVTWDKFGLMLRTLHGQGLRNIIGDIVLDRPHFQPGRLDADIVQFGETPDNYYNVIPNALLINGNLLDFEFESTSDNIKILSSPPLAQVIIKNQLRLNDSPCAS